MLSVGNVSAWIGNANRYRLRVFLDKCCIEAYVTTRQTSAGNVDPLVDEGGVDGVTVSVRSDDEYGGIGAEPFSGEPTDRLDKIGIGVIEVDNVIVRQGNHIVLSGSHPNDRSPRRIERGV